jgi:hypothetical protein
VQKCGTPQAPTKKFVIKRENKVVSRIFTQ